MWRYSFLLVFILIPFCGQTQNLETISMDANTLFSIPSDTVKLTEYEQSSIRQDEDVIRDLTEKKIDYKIIPPQEKKKLAEKIDDELKKLLRERDRLMSENPNSTALSSKNGAITILEKEKEIVDLSITSSKLKEEADRLTEDKERIKMYSFYAGGGAVIIFLGFAVYMQKRKIKTQDVELEKQLRDIAKKNTYLEYAAVLIRHDMHSGINTYIPRGINGLEKRISSEKIKELNIESPLKMIKEGLGHTQKVYKRVYEFTNLVKQNQVLDKELSDVTSVVQEYLKSTGYASQVELKTLGNFEINPTLFCLAMDNIIKNGLKYNDSETKWVKIYRENNSIVVEDNGRGMDQKKLDEILSAYSRGEGDSALGLNITSAILEEHDFILSCESTGRGTKIKIEL